MMSDKEFEAMSDKEMFDQILEQVSDDHVRDVLKQKDRILEDYRAVFGLYPWESPIPGWSWYCYYRIPLACWESQYPKELMDPQSYNPYTGTVRVYVVDWNPPTDLNEGMSEIECDCDEYLQAIFEKLSSGETVTVPLKIPDSVWKKHVDPGVIEHEVSICEEM